MVPQDRFNKVLKARTCFQTGRESPHVGAYHSFSYGDRTIAICYYCCERYKDVESMLSGALIVGEGSVEYLLWLYATVAHRDRARLKSISFKTPDAESKTLSAFLEIYEERDLAKANTMLNSMIASLSEVSDFLVLLQIKSMCPALIEHSLDLLQRHFFLRRRILRTKQTSSSTLHFTLTQSLQIESSVTTCSTVSTLSAIRTKVMSFYGMSPETDSD